MAEAPGLASKAAISRENMARGRELVSKAAISEDWHYPNPIHGGLWNQGSMGQCWLQLQKTNPGV